MKTTGQKNIWQIDWKYEGLLNISKYFARFLHSNELIESDNYFGTPCREGADIMPVRTNKGWQTETADEMQLGEVGSSHISILLIKEDKVTRMVPQPFNDFRLDKILLTLFYLTWNNPKSDHIRCGCVVQEFPWGL